MPCYASVPKMMQASQAVTWKSENIFQAHYLIVCTQSLISAKNECEQSTPIMQDSEGCLVPPSFALRVSHVLHCACVLLACLSLAKINPFTPVCANNTYGFYSVLLQKILPINGEPLLNGCKLNSGKLDQCNCDSRFLLQSTPYHMG